MTTLTPEQIYSQAIKAGFDKATATTMTAIALAESSGNAGAHNPNASTGDNSYGLWQINMLGGMGPSRRTQLGIGNNEQLYDPTTNAKAAYAIYKQQGLSAWSTYRGGSYKTYLDKAQAGAAEYTRLTGIVNQAQKDINANQPSLLDKAVTSDPANAVAKAVGPFDFVGGAWDQVNDRWFWVRIAFILGGFIVIMIGVASLSKSGTLTQPTPATPLQGNGRAGVVGKARRAAETGAAA